MYIGKYFSFSFFFFSFLYTNQIQKEIGKNPLYS